ALSAVRAGAETDRARAIDALGALHSAEAVQELSDVLLSDDDASLRERSATSLGKIRDPSIPALQDALLKDPVSSVSVSAAEALGHIGGSQLGLTHPRCLLFLSVAHRRQRLRGL